MLRAPLWQVAEKGKTASLKILSVQKLLGQEPTKSRVVPPAAGVAGDFKTVEQQDPLLASQTITIKATGIAALAHDPPRRFLEIDKNLIVINGDIFEHLAPEMMCPAWLYEEMAPLSPHRREPPRPGGGDTWTMHAWRVTPATPASKQSKKRPKT